MIREVPKMLGESNRLAYKDGYKYQTQEDFIIKYLKKFLD